MESDFSMITPSFNKQSSLLLDLLFQAIPLLEQIPPLFTLAEVDKIRTVGCPVIAFPISSSSLVIKCLLKLK